MSIDPSPHELLATEIRRLWWLPLLRGLLLVILGGYALFAPDMTVGALATVIGLFAILDGIFAVAAGILGEVPSSRSAIIRGVIEILVGLFVVANPLLVSGITARILLYILAFTAILCGVLETLGAIQDRRQFEGAGCLFLTGALTILFGILVLAAPIAFGLFIVRILGIFAILSGISYIGFAWRLRQFGKLL